MNIAVMLVVLTILLLLGVELEAKKGGHLSDYKGAQEYLKAFYGEYLPDIKIRFVKNYKMAHFKDRGDVVVIGRNLNKWQAESFVVHESSHVALLRMTQGKSVQEPFRFIDEGLANYLEQSYLGHADEYLKYSCSVAVHKADKNLKLSALQKWKKYFGPYVIDADVSHNNFNAYYVAASFVGYLDKTYGRDVLKKFLLDLGKTGSIDKSFRNIFDKSGKSVEKGWRGYLHRCSYSDLHPKIVETVPKGSDVNVNPNITELTIVFNQPMDPHIICIISKCPEICFTNAYWKDDFTLAVRVGRTLGEGRTYRIEVGSDETGCLMRNSIGVKLTPVKYQFRTGR